MAESDGGGFQNARAAWHYNKMEVSEQNPSGERRLSEGGRMCAGRGDLPRMGKCKSKEVRIYTPGEQ